MKFQPLARLFLFLSVLAALALPATAARTGAGRSADPLGQVFAVQRQLRDLHPAFQQLYPIAVVRDQRISVYVPVPAHWSYRLVASGPDSYNMPEGVRAAMPLDFWGGRIACVVTPDVFDTPGGYVAIFHEFVHCYQWETCEMHLKEKMEVFRQAQARHDFMWELQHPFPYEDPAFRRDYEAMLKSLAEGDLDHARADRKAIRERLSGTDWEYMTWEEWKEGLARYLENAVNARLGLPENRGGRRPPFSRVSFYAGGEGLIRALAKGKPALAKDIEALYHRIAD
jgi:hypothetical protein